MEANRKAGGLSVEIFTAGVRGDGAKCLVMSHGRELVEIWISRLDATVSSVTGRAGWEHPASLGRIQPANRIAVASGTKC